MKTQLDNGYLSYDLIGNRTPMLLIHGYPLSREIWQPQIKGLSDLVKIIAPDLRGHGESFSFSPPYSMDLLAQDNKLLLDDLSIRTPVIVNGLSMGGYIAFSMYRLYPGSFKAIILTSTRAGEDSDEGKANRDASIKKAREDGVEAIVESMLPKMLSPKTYENTPDLVNRVKRIMTNTSINGVVGALEGMRDRPDSTSMLRAIELPVLIIHGEDDQLIPVKEAEIMQRNLPNATLKVIPGSGHLPNLEQPDIYNQVVREFIVPLT